MKFVKHIMLFGLWAAIPIIRSFCLLGLFSFLLLFLFLLCWLNLLILKDVFSKREAMIKYLYCWVSVANRCWLLWQSVKSIELLTFSKPRYFSPSGKFWTSTWAGMSLLELYDYTIFRGLIFAYFRCRNSSPPVFNVLHHFKKLLFLDIYNSLCSRGFGVLGFWG